MISLHRSRSVVALIASVLTFGLCLVAVAGGLIADPTEITPERGDQLFKLFTVCSNCFAALGAAMMIPYAVEGVRKKRFTYPKCVQLLQYSGACCTTLTMIFAFCLIWPILGASIAFEGMNFWLHVICPIMSLILLFSVEADLELTVNDALICLAPFYVYAATYITNVVLIGEQNGGWRDIYRLVSIVPATLSTPLMYLLGFAIALAIRQIYNRISHARQKEMRMLWSEELTPVEVKTEVLGLGRHSGIHDDFTNITVPFDIFYGLAERYDVTVTELAAAYNRGVLDGLEEREEYLEDRREYYDTLFGTPEKLQKKTGE